MLVVELYRNNIQIIILKKHTNRSKLRNLIGHIFNDYQLIYILLLLIKYIDDKSNNIQNY